MNLPADFDVAALHDLVAGLHMPYYAAGEPDRQIDMMLAAVLGGRLRFFSFDASGRADWYAKAALLVAAGPAPKFCIAREAWAAALPRSGDPVRALMPSQREDRMEVVTTVAVDSAGGRASSVKLIERYHDGPRAGAVQLLADAPMLTGVADGDMLRLFELERFV